MKKLVLSLAVIAFMLASCGEKKSKTHQHEDGSEHKEHLETNHQQEEFRVAIDSVSNTTEKHEHNHEKGHQH